MLTATDGNRASSYTGLGISVAITFIVLRFPPVTLIRIPSQGMMGNWIMSSERWKNLIFEHTEWDPRMIMEWCTILCRYYDHKTHAKAFYAILLSAYEYLTFP